MPAKKEDAILIERVKMETIPIKLVGMTGLYCHRMSAKAKRQLMIGGQKKTRAERIELKHQPRDEFRDSMHIHEGYHEYTHVKFPSMAIKSAMATAALSVAGVRKADVQRLVFFPDEWVPIFGVPRLRMDITRSADIGKTPDVRTRAYFPEWGTELLIQYVKPVLTPKAIVSLLYNAGIMCGIGDFRQEKGKGSYGTFEPTNDPWPESMTDPDAQWDAIQNPVPDNEESAELLEEFDLEVEARK